MKKIVYTDPKTFEEPVIEVDDRLSESQITSAVGHDDWDYAIGDVPVTHALKPKKGIVAVASVIALLPFFILPVSAEWQSQWKTGWAEVNNTRYLIPYFPGKRLIDDSCYYLWSDGSLRSDGSPNQGDGKCNEG